MIQVVRVNIKDQPYNAVGDGTTDDGPAIIQAIGDGIRAPLTYTTEIYVPEGVYFFGATQQPIFKHKGVKIIGEVDSNGDPLAEFVFDGFGLTLFADFAADAALAVDAKRGDTQIQVNTAGMQGQVGDVVSIRNSVAADQSWSIPALYTGKCTAITGDLITLNHPLPFDFPQTAVGNAVTQYRHPGVIEVENLILRQRGASPVFGLVLHGLRSPVVRNLRLINDVPGTNGCLLLKRCTDSLVEDVNAQNAEIGIEISDCLDTTMRRIKSSGTIHGISAQNWTDGLYCDDFFSAWDDGGFDCHPSFNINFSNFQVYCRKQPNLRSIGGSLRNGAIHAASGMGGGEMLMFSVLPVDESLFLNYGLEMENVTICQPDAPHFRISKAGWLKMTDCSIDSPVLLGGATKLHNFDLRGIDTPSITAVNTDILQNTVIKS